MISGSGFLGNLSISWNQDLNVIIGGKRVGKSAILECLRYAFAITPHSDPSYHEELVRHALGSGGKVEVILDLPVREEKIHQYRIVRVWGGAPQTFQVNPEKSIPVSPSELLGTSGGLTIFGQREIYAVSGREEQRLAFLDELIGGEARKRAEAIDKAIESLTANTGAILNIQAKSAKREEYGQRLKSIEQEIEVYKRNVAEKPKEVADLRRAGECLQNVANSSKSTLDDFDGWRLNLLNSLDAARQTLMDAQNKHTAFLQEGATVLSVLQESLKVVLDDQRTLFEQAIQNLTRLNHRCQEKLRPLEEESKRIEQEAKREPPGQDRLLKLTEEKASLTSLIGELNEVEDRLKTLRKKRQGLLQQVIDCRAIQNKLRKERAGIIAESLKDCLHLQVAYKGQKGSYKE
jgi:chromosome segregation ATPase